MARITDTLNAFDRQWVAEVARLDVPLRSVVNLRRVAGELRALAVRLDHLSRDPRPAADVLFEARRATRHTNHNLQAIRKPGRPSKRPTKSSADTSW